MIIAPRASWRMRRPMVQQTALDAYSASSSDPHRLIDSTGTFSTYLKDNLTKRVSVAAWVKRNGASDAASYERVFTEPQGTVTGLLLGVHITTPSWTIGGRSSSADSFHSLDHSKTVVNGQWHVIGGTLDFENGIIRLSVDGDEEYTTTSWVVPYWAASAFTNVVHGLFANGGSGTEQFTGAIAQFAVWRDITLRGQDFADMMNGAHISRIRPESLVGCFSLGESMPAPRNAIYLRPHMLRIPYRHYFGYYNDPNTTSVNWGLTRFGMTETFESANRPRIHVSGFAPPATVAPKAFNIAQQRRA